MFACFMFADLSDVGKSKQMFEFLLQQIPHSWGE